jgi:hypothetical protein
MSIASACPKCGRERKPGEDACARCGLLVARWATFATAAPAHPELDALWAAVDAGWDDDAAHARFLDEAARLGALDVAAARYGKRLRQENDARARVGLERAALLAERLHAADVAATPAEPAARWLKVLGVALAALLFVAGAWLLVVALRR